MIKKFLFILLLFISTASWSQRDSISLQIMGQKVCINKKTSELTFQYFFENHSEKHLVILDYYPPCSWEKPVGDEDSSATQGLYLIIKDDSGNVVLPLRIEDSLALEPSKQDSVLFFEEYEGKKLSEYMYHTRSLRPRDVLINYYSLKLNKRKCFFNNKFIFDYRRNYTVSLHYFAGDDVFDLLNKGYMSKHDEAFLGHIASNEVNLCFQ